LAGTGRRWDLTKQRITHFSFRSFASRSMGEFEVAGTNKKRKRV